MDCIHIYVCVCRYVRVSSRVVRLPPNIWSPLSSQSVADTVTSYLANEQMELLKNVRGRAGFSLAWCHFRAIVTNRLPAPGILTWFIELFRELPPMGQILLGAAARPVLYKFSTILLRQPVGLLGWKISPLQDLSSQLSSLVLAFQSPCLLYCRDILNYF